MGPHQVGCGSQGTWDGAVGSGEARSGGGVHLRLSLNPSFLGHTVRKLTKATRRASPEGSGERTWEAAQM